MICAKIFRIVLTYPRKMAQFQNIKPSDGQKLSLRAEFYRCDAKVLNKTGINQRTLAIPNFILDNRRLPMQSFAILLTNSSTVHCRCEPSTKNMSYFNLQSKCRQSFLLTLLSLLFAANGLIARNGPVQYAIDIELGDQQAARIGVSF